MPDTHLQIFKGRSLSTVRVLVLSIPEGRVLLIDCFELIHVQIPGLVQDMDCQVHPGLQQPL